MNCCLKNSIWSWAIWLCHVRGCDHPTLWMYRSKSLCKTFSWSNGRETWLLEIFFTWIKYFEVRMNWTWIATDSSSGCSTEADVSTVSDHVKRLRIGFQFARMDWKHLSITIATSKVSIPESTLCSRNSVRHFPFTAEHCVNPPTNAMRICIISISQRGKLRQKRSSLCWGLHLELVIFTFRLLIFLTASVMCVKGLRHWLFWNSPWDSKAFGNLPRLYGLLINFCSASISWDCGSGAAPLDKQSAGPSGYDASPHRSHLPEPPSRPLSLPLGLTSSQPVSPLGTLQPGHALEDASHFL